MVRRMSKSNWWLKEMVYWITGLNDARSNMAIPNWNRCIEICNRSSPHSVRLEWWQTPNIIHIENLFTSRMKLKSMIVNYCQLFRHWGLAKFFCGYHYLNLVLWVNSPSDFYDLVTIDNKFKPFSILYKSEVIINHLLFWSLWLSSTLLKNY